MASNLCHQVAVSFHCPALAPYDEVWLLSSRPALPLFRGKVIVPQGKTKAQIRFMQNQTWSFRRFPKRHSACVTLELQLTAVFCLKLSCGEQCLVLCPVQGMDPKEVGSGRWRCVSCWCLTVGTGEDRPTCKTLRGLIIYLLLLL